MRVSNELGAGRPAAARLAAQSVAVLALSLMAGIAILLASLHRVLPLVITSDPAVIDGTQRVIPIVAYMLIGDGMNACMSGVVRGCGQQAKGRCTQLVHILVMQVPMHSELLLRQSVVPIVSSQHPVSITAQLAISCKVLPLCICPCCCWVDSCFLLIAHDDLTKTLGTSVFAAGCRCWRECGDILVHRVTIGCAAGFPWAAGCSRVVEWVGMYYHSPGCCHEHFGAQV